MLNYYLIFKIIKLHTFIFKYFLHDVIFLNILIILFVDAIYLISSMTLNI